MEEFRKRVARHIEHVKNVGSHCITEETTKQALILPLLDILGFSPYDPTLVKAEYGSDFSGVKASERVDYALFSNGAPVIFIEAKAYAQNLTNHCPQLSRYYNATPEVTVSAITNGREWRFFTDLVHRNIMDREPFLTIDLEQPDEDIAEQLHRFHHDQLQPGTLRALAEESIFLAEFRKAITSSLRECDLEFVRYIAGQSNVQRSLTVRFLESVQPLVKQAVAQSISELVATSLTAPERAVEHAETVDSASDLLADVVSENGRIRTTGDERRLFEICCDILPGEDLQPRDTETYFSIVHKGKSTRWLLRFWGDKRKPSVQFIHGLTDEGKAEVLRSGLEVSAGGQIVLGKPENLYRLAGMLNDAFNYCTSEENFKRSSSEVGSDHHNDQAVPESNVLNIHPAAIRRTAS
ncbi:MAG TPA: type I restriction endonuclease [Burkholderiaceae bacterium]|nr:type I restriction endonuclease [Burkholderiaceae bacterium]